VPSPLLLALAGCGVGFDAVTIKPIFGYDDGCTAVTISGYGFGADVTANIGGAPVTDIALPDEERDPDDVGFNFTASTPPGRHGYADVEVLAGSESSVIEHGFYYVECPGDPWPRAVNAVAVPGEPLTIWGCNLDAEAYTVQVATGEVYKDGVDDGPTAPLTSECGQAKASFVMPDASPGFYRLLMLDAAGDVVHPVQDCDTGGDCGAAVFISVGGAR